MNSKCLIWLAKAFVFTVLSTNVFANPLHKFVTEKDEDGIIAYIRESNPSLAELTEVDENGDTPIEIAKRTHNDGLIKLLAQTERFLRTAEQFRGRGMMHPIHIFVARGDVWGFTLFLTYYDVTYAEFMHGVDGRNVYEIAREAGNAEMTDLVHQTVIHYGPAAALSPLREVTNVENVNAQNPQNHADAKAKEEDDTETETFSLVSDDENSNANLFGSDPAGLFFEFEDDDKLVKGAFGVLSPRF